MYLSIPLRFSEKTGLSRVQDEAAAIREVLELLVSTPKGSCEADPEDLSHFQKFGIRTLNAGQYIDINDREHHQK